MCVCVWGGGGGQVGMYVYMCMYIHTAISKEIVIVNSRYWNRKELWSSSITISIVLGT